MDADDTATTTSIDGFRVMTEAYRDLTVAFDPKYDRDYFLPYVLHSEGDSFSTHRGRVVFINLYQDMHIAYENVRRICWHYECNDELPEEKRNRVALMEEDGSIREVSAMA